MNPVALYLTTRKAGYSTELTAIINKAQSSGFTLPATRQLQSIDAFIATLKSSGLWSKMDRIYNFAFNNSPNLIRYSQQIDNAEWLKSNSTVTGNSGLAPDSTTSADKIIDNTANFTHYVQQNVACLANTNYTLSFYLKGQEKMNPQVNFNDGVTGMIRVFNLTNGTVDIGTGTTITSVGNGWYYCTMTRQTGAAATTLQPAFYTQAGAYIGDGLAGFYLWGVQIEYGNTATTYQATPTTLLQNFSRIDWKNPATSPLITINGTMTYIETGFSLDGTTGYLDTGFIPSTHAVNYTLNNAGRTAMLYATGGGGSTIDGNSSNNNAMFSTATSNHKINATLALTGGNVSLGGAGMGGIYRDSNTVIRIIKRLTETTGRTQTADVMPTVAQWIGRNSTGYGLHTFAFYAIGSSLTLAQATSLRDNYNTFLVNLGLPPNTLT
jgi:hypothetical protein